MNHELLINKMKENPEKYEPVYKAYYEEPILIEPLREIEDRLYNGEKNSFGKMEDLYLGRIIYVSRIVDELDKDNNPFREYAVKARELLVLINDTSAVVKAKAVVQKLGGENGVYQDILQACRVRMLEIAEQYDYRKGFRFKTFVEKALYQITYSTYNEITNTISKGLCGTKEIWKLNKAEEKLLSQGKHATALELARELNCTVQKIEKIRRTAQLQSVDLDSTAHLVTTNEDFSNKLLEDSFPEILTNLIDKELSEEEKTILNYRYGLDGRQAKTLVETGLELGFSSEKVRLMEKAALQKLRHGDSSFILKEYLKLI